MESVSGAVLITDEFGRVLLLRQGYRGKRWTLPGGRVEPGESPREAALRELREETKLQARIVGLHGVYHKAGGTNPGIRFVFAARLRAGKREEPKIDGSEITEWWWADPRDVPKRSTRVVRQVCGELAGSVPRERYAEL